MKLPKTFIPGVKPDSKTNQLLKEPKIIPPEEDYNIKIERIVRKYDEDYDFLLTDSEINSVLEKLSAAHLEGLERIIIERPSKNEHFKLFGRYERGFKVDGKYLNGKVHLFKHLKNADGLFVVELGLQPDGDYETRSFVPKEFKFKNYVTLLHEIGHHVGIKYFNDESEEFARNYVQDYHVILPEDALFL